jgi:endonuclease YncB( thermonuclease family)
MSNTFPISVGRVIDGDTLVADITLPEPSGIILANRVIRLASINCPELGTDEGIAAKDFTIRWLLMQPNPNRAFLHCGRLDKYRRWLGTISGPGVQDFLTDALIEAGFAARCADAVVEGEVWNDS